MTNKTLIFILFTYICCFKSVIAQDLKESDQNNKLLNYYFDIGANLYPGGYEKIIFLAPSWSFHIEEDYTKFGLKLIRSYDIARPIVTFGSSPVRSLGNWQIDINNDLLLTYLHERAGNKKPIFFSLGHLWVGSSPIEKQERAISFSTGIQISKFFGEIRAYSFYENSYEPAIIGRLSYRFKI